MRTLNEQLETINTFNNAGIISVDFFTWGGSMVKFEANSFAIDGIKRELDIKIEKLKNGSYMFVSTLPNVA
jgi:hypothetical protein